MKLNKINRLKLYPRKFVSTCESQEKGEVVRMQLKKFYVFN